MATSPPGRPPAASRPLRASVHLLDECASTQSCSRRMRRRGNGRRRRRADGGPRAAGATWEAAAGYEPALLGRARPRVGPERLPELTLVAGKRPRRRSTRHWPSRARSSTRTTCSSQAARSRASSARRATAAWCSGSAINVNVTAAACRRTSRRRRRCSSRRAARPTAASSWPSSLERSSARYDAWLAERVASGCGCRQRRRDSSQRRERRRTAARR